MANDAMTNDQTLTQGGPSANSNIEIAGNDVRNFLTQRMQRARRGASTVSAPLCENLRALCVELVAHSTSVSFATLSSGQRDEKSDYLAAKYAALCRGIGWHD